ncbi:MAG: hypothetical protein IAC69_00550 [Proteobacteria bacterium]|uniref:Uncharacterized protein n=1 Tax=Candidatus Enterousia avistercoris TaxID=2840788 RepID=A0A9D9DCK4_9PROT|nr:hypothetical protein [Candidatus Enterousia avistercoris]
MARFTLLAVLAGFVVFNANAATENVVYDNFQTIYTETPVQSYYAYPDDPNFIPETEFMNRADSLDYDFNIEEARQIESMMHPGVMFADRPMVICRNFGCTRLNDRITRTFLFNSLANMFMMNEYSRLYICEADPFSRDCLQSGISFPVRSGIANALVKIPKATISQVNLSTGLSKATVNMTYEFLVNGIARTCEPTIMDIVIPINSQATLSNREFACNMTSDGLSNVSLLVNIDYIDLDYGILGGYYSLGMQGPTTGGGTGYALFKTEFTTGGMQFRAAVNEESDMAGTNSMMTIQPGEYAVEPLRK